MKKLLLLIFLNFSLGFYLDQDYNHEDYHDLTIFDNSKIALDNLLQNSNDKKLLFNLKKDFNENNLLEFITRNIIDSNSENREESVEFLNLMERILIKYETEKNKKKTYQEMSPNFIKYLIFYLNFVLDTQTTKRTANIEISRKSVKKILEFLKQLEFNKNSTVSIKSGDLNANKLDQVIEMRLNLTQFNSKNATSASVSLVSDSTSPDIVYDYTENLNEQNTTEIVLEENSSN